MKTATQSQIDYILALQERLEAKGLGHYGYDEDTLHDMDIAVASDYITDLKADLQGN